MAPNSAPILRMQGITKRFPGVTALDRVNLEVRPGEVHLLLGENGAGKSTLMKILSGAYGMDEGSVSLAGDTVTIRSPLHARQLGIAMIYQEMNLVPHLTVAENIFLGRERTLLGFVRRKVMEEEARRVLATLHAGFGPGALVRDLPVAQQQLVEVSKALSINARIIVMDEPTSPLTQREVNDLFRIIRSLRKSGVAIIYISHRLEEARAIGDRVTVLRDGRNVGTTAVRAVSDSALVQMMVGRKISQVFPPRPPVRGGEFLKVEGLARDGVVGPASFTVRAGEILGFAGLIGSGRTELMRCLIGADTATAGNVTVGGRTGRFMSPEDAKRHGVCLLPEDRKAQGLVLGLSVLHNVSLAALSRFTRFGFLRTGLERRTVASLVEKLNVRTPGLEQVARNLSGGNQQKLVLAKWLAVEPRVIIFDEPTRGIDVGAKFEVYRLITALAAQGTAIILISSDLPEVLGLSHRVAVMCQGRLAGILPRRSATPVSVMRRAMGVAAA